MWDGAAIQQIDSNARSTRNPQSEYQQRAQQQYYEQQRYYQEQQAAQMPPLPASAYDGPAGAPPRTGSAEKSLTYLGPSPTAGRSTARPSAGPTSTRPSTR